MPEVQITRKGIRHDVIARLKAANTTAGDRVFGPRTTKIPDELLPALLVYCQTGDGKNVSGDAPILRWGQELAVECVVSGESDEAMGDALDDLADAVEDVLLCDPVFVAMFEKIPGVRFDMAFDDAGRRRMSAAKVAFSLEFCRVYEPRIDDEPDLVTVAIKADTMPTDGAFEAVATIDLDA